MAFELSSHIQSWSVDYFFASDEPKCSEILVPIVNAADDIVYNIRCFFVLERLPPRNRFAGSDNRQHVYLMEANRVAFKYFP